MNKMAGITTSEVAFQLSRSSSFIKASPVASSLLACSSAVYFFSGACFLLQETRDIPAAIASRSIMLVKIFFI